jgi:uroporphyrinogen decarboxylase
VVVQGNLDPEILASDKQAMLKEARTIIDTLKSKAFVFNLGHGILPNTPVENMQALCEFLKGQ